VRQCYHAGMSGVWKIAATAALMFVWAAARMPAQQRPAIPPLARVRPIAPPPTPLPDERASAGVTRFSFIAYGDTRCDCRTAPVNLQTLEGDPREVQAEHARVVDAMVSRVRALASTPYPVRFVVSSGDAVWSGLDAARWNDVFTPIVEKITVGAGLPYFFTLGNHDVTASPAGTFNHSLGLHNALSAVSRLIPPEGSPRRLNGYLTYAFGYGNAFFLMLDSNIAGDDLQFAWTADQLEHLDRGRYRHVIVVLHHPPFTSGRYSGVSAPSGLLANGQSAASPGLGAAAPVLRQRYMPLFRAHHVRMIIAGHDHLYDHWIERYVDGGRRYRIDAIVSGGGGAPSYVYTGEPDLTAYLAAGAGQQVTMEHAARPAPAQADNPHHFVVIRVDGDRLSLEVVSVGPAPLAPYHGSPRTDLND
jgi:3',5'-cyclic AMP phosphodiesterase CpdA